MTKKRKKLYIMDISILPKLDGFVQNFNKRFDYSVHTDSITKRVFLTNVFEKHVNKIIGYVHGYIDGQGIFN